LRALLARVCAYIHTYIYNMIHHTRVLVPSSWFLVPRFLRFFSFLFVSRITSSSRRRDFFIFILSQSHRSICRFQPSHRHWVFLAWIYVSMYLCIYVCTVMYVWILHFFKKKNSLVVGRRRKRKYIHTVHVRTARCVYYTSDKV